MLLGLELVITVYLRFVIFMAGRVSAVRVSSAPFFKSQLRTGICAADTGHFFNTKMLNIIFVHQSTLQIVLGGWIAQKVFVHGHL